MDQYIQLFTGRLSTEHFANIIKELTTVNRLRPQHQAIGFNRSGIQNLINGIE